MTLIKKLDSLVKVKMEISDLNDLNTEWYDNLEEWQNCIWSWVNKLEPYKTRNNVLTLKASILEIRDEKSLKRFRDFGSKPTYHYISLEKIRDYMDNSSYTHIFIYGIGELNNEEIKDFYFWLSMKL